MLKFLAKKTGLWLLFLSFAGTLTAQSKQTFLSLKSAIDSALANNKDLQLAGLDEKIAASRFKQTDAVFLPQVDLSYSAITTNNPLNAFGFKLQQQTVKQADFNTDVLNHPGNTSDFSTKAQLQQPILNLDLLYMRKAAAKETETYQLKTQRTREFIAFEVEKGYLQLQLQHEEVKVLKDALVYARSVYDFTNNRVEQGLFQKSDALNVKVQVSSFETKLAEAESNVKNASDYLSLLMGTPYANIYTTDSSAPAITAHSPGDTLVPGSRADIAAMQTAIDASELMIQSTRKSYLPKVNAFATYQLNDAAALGFSASSYLAGVQMSWSIFKGNSVKNKIATQRLEKTRLREQLDQVHQQSQLELNKTWRQLEDAKFQISRQQTAVQNAEEALRILKDRYEQGLTNSTDVLLAQTQLAQQKLGLSQAVYNHNVTFYYLQFLTTTIK
jgi:outer membrane protein TolC